MAVNVRRHKSRHEDEMGLFDSSSQEQKPKKKVKQQKPEENTSEEWRRNPDKQPDPTEEAPHGWLWDRSYKQWRPRKSNAGRKKFKGKVHTTNIDIPDDLYEKFQKYSGIIGNNMTAYIIKLIRKDFESNEQEYQKIIKQIDNLN